MFHNHNNMQYFHQDIFTITIILGATTSKGPGSIKHAAGKCIRSIKRGHDKPPEDSEMVFYTGCGKDKMEFKLDANDHLRLTMHNMCLRSVQGTVGKESNVYKVL